MTAKYDLVKEEDKSFDGEYIYCDQCEWNGTPNQKIVMVYLGTRCANEPGFIQKYETYDYSQDRAKDIHRHKYNPNVIYHIIDQIFDRAWRSAE